MAEPSGSSGPAAAARSDLGAFLRARRESLDPKDFAFPSTGRRRTSGLRREEVATLAAVSVTYYTYLEQGRERHPSAQVLAALGAALRLSPAERDHLATLAGRGVPAAAAPNEPSPDALHPLLTALVDRWDPSPAYITGPTFDVLASNASCRYWWTDWDVLPPAQRNMLWWIFTDPVARQRFPEWESEAAKLLARFRATAVRHPTDARFDELTDRLLAASPQARRWWAGQQVRGYGSGRKLLTHPDRPGTVVTFEHTVLLAAGVADTKLVVFQQLPEDGDNAAAGRS